jgi:hypothetical protein
MGITSGEYSLDKISERYKRHGLELKLPERDKVFNNPKAFFNSIECKCLSPGFFLLFYENLVPCAIHVQGEIHDIIPNTFGSKTFLKPNLLIKCASSLATDILLTSQLNALDLVKTLPDMYDVLVELAIEPNLCRGSIKCRLERHYSSPDGGIRYQKSRSISDFFINNITIEQRAHLLALHQNDANINPVPDFDLHPHLLRLNSIVESENPPEEIEVPHPGMVDDSNGTKYYVLHPDDYLCEPAMHFVLLYCLGMLSRYHPHVWMKATENSLIAELADSLLNVIYRKFPGLILDQMTETLHHIHP